MSNFSSGVSLPHFIQQNLSNSINLKRIAIKIIYYLTSATRGNMLSSIKQQNTTYSKFIQCLYQLV